MTRLRHGFRPQRWQYRWNSDNRFTALYTPNDEHWRYRYDAFGRRTRKFNLSRSNAPSNVAAPYPQRFSKAIKRLGLNRREGFNLDCAAFCPPGRQLALL